MAWTCFAWLTSLSRCVYTAAHYYATTCILALPSNPFTYHREPTTAPPPCHIFKPQRALRRLTHLWYSTYPSVTYLKMAYLHAIPFARSHPLYRAPDTCGTSVASLRFITLKLISSDASKIQYQHCGSSCARGIQKGTNVVSTNGVAANFMLFDRGTFCVLPYSRCPILIFPKVPGCTFFPNLSNSLILQRPH